MGISNSSKQKKSKENNNLNKKVKKYNTIDKNLEIISNEIEGIDESDFKQFRGQNLSLKNEENILYNENNEIRMEIKIRKEDVNKDIYFIDNDYKDENEITINPHNGYHNHLKELNISNTELFINDKKYEYKKYFIPEKEGIYSIKLKFNILINILII